MDAAQVERGVAAARSIASELGLTVDDAVVLQRSNTLTLRLLPCDVVARVSPRGPAVARLEVDIARALAPTGSPVMQPDPRVAPGPYEDDGVVVTLWTHYASVGPAPSPTDVADALERLHAGMQTVDVATPHFTDRVAEAQRLVADPHRTPGLSDADRTLLGTTLRDQRRAIGDRRAPEQLLHGEPHPGNVLSTADGLRFIDLETCCIGPVEFDLAHVTEAVSQCYRSADRDLLGECRGLVLAMVAAWRWDPADRLPDGRRAAQDLVAAVRHGPPWPVLDDVVPPAPGPS